MEISSRNPMSIDKRESFGGWLVMGYVVRSKGNGGILWKTGKRYGVHISNDLTVGIFCGKIGKKVWCGHYSKYRDKIPFFKSSASNIVAKTRRKNAQSAKESAKMTDTTDTTDTTNTTSNELELEQTRQTRIKNVMNDIEYKLTLINEND